VNRDRAIERACTKARETGERWIVVCSQDHPKVEGDYFYAIRWADKHAWTPGESLIVFV
jgi:hypothetical protein